MPPQPRAQRGGMHRGRAPPPQPSASADLLFKALGGSGGNPCGLRRLRGGERPCCRSSGLRSPSAAALRGGRCCRNGPWGCALGIVEQSPYGPQAL